MNRRSTPEADAQRAIVQALRVALPRDAIIHHCANEVTEPGSRGQIRQSILIGMGVHTGFADLIVISGGRVLFLVSKARPAACANRKKVSATRSSRRDLAGRWSGRSTMRWARWPIMASPAVCARCGG